MGISLRLDEIDLMLSQTSMKTKSLVLAVIPAITVVISPLRADTFQILSANRYVSISGFAGAANGTSSYSNTQPASASILGGTQWVDTNHGINYANSSASQTSFLGSEFFSLSSSLGVTAAAPSILGAGTGTCKADALSYFEVSFAVGSPVSYNLLFPALSNNGLSNAVGPNGGVMTDVFQLSSQLNGGIVSMNFNPSNSSSFISPGNRFSGSLLPGDVYTITFTEHLSAFTDPFPRSGQLAGNFLFTVPEEGGILNLLIALAAFALAGFKMAAGGAQRGQRPGAALNIVTS